MPKLVNGSADVTINKKTGTVLTVLADQSYVDGDPVFNISVHEGTGAAGSASLDVSVNTATGTAGGTNVGSIIGTKATTEPSSGYYLRMDASGSINAQITDAGWMDAGSIAGDSANASRYFPVSAGAVTQNAPTVNSSTGVVTATVSTTAGYVPTQATSDSNTLQLSTQAAATITPSRSQQTAVVAGKYTTGDVVVAAIPNTYYTLQELYPIGAFYSDTSGTNPGTTLGFGTWELIRSVPYQWLDVSTNTWQAIDYSSAWSFDDKVVANVYVYKRTA